MSLPFGTTKWPTLARWNQLWVNKVRFRNQISTLPQPNFDDSATKIRYASATKKRRFRNQKKRFRNQKRTIPQPKQDDSATKNRRFRNQNPRDSETKIRVTLQPRSVLLHSAWHRLQVPHSTWHRLQMQWVQLRSLLDIRAVTLNMASSSDAVGWGGVGQ